jgi:uncharacterized membrane protein (DUF4010 family)
MDMSSLAPGSALGLMVAGGGGLLIGLERERRKGQGGNREAAGIRSFSLAALGGGLAQSLQQPALVALGAALVATLSALAYWRSLRIPPGAVPDAVQHPGVTTELALFVTYLVGVLAVQQPALGAAAAVAVATLLAARERLHRFATRALSDAELHDALLLAALALVLLPLAPAEGLPWLAGLAPRTLLLLVVLILALQAAGHVALRLLGPRTGLALSGLLSGFVSSTATIASMGARARHAPDQRAACLAGAVWSTAATWLQAMVMLAALAPAAAAALLPVAATGAVVAGAVGALWLARARTVGGPTVSATSATVALPATASPPAAGPQVTAQTTDAQPGPLRVREALWVVALLSGVAVVVGWAQQRFGDAGLWVGTALSALADAHASVVALGALNAAGSLAPAQVVTGVLVAIGANACTRSITAFVAGGRAYGWAVATALLLSTAAAAGAAWVIRGLSG